MTDAHLPSAESDALATRLRASAAELEALQPALTAAGRWSLAARFDHSDEAAWGPPEILAHVDELVPYWLGELARVLDGRGASDPPTFGRVATDDVRLAIIERDRTVPLTELLDRARGETERAARRVERLGDDDLATLGTHPVRGPIAVREILERFLAAHLEEHVRQLREAIETSGRLPTA